MFELFQDFEKVATRFDAFLLILPGIFCLIAGLLLWLGGLGHRVSLALIAGAVTGGIWGFFISGRNLIVAAIAAVALAVAALLASRVFTAILAAALITILTFVLLINPHLTDADSFSYHTPGEQRLDPAETRRAAEAFWNHLGEAIKTAAARMPAYKFIIPPVCGLILLIVAFFAKRIALAACCSVLGTALIFCGMILLLFYKGSMPVSSIAENQPFYSAVVAAMVSFGILAQLLLARHHDHKHPRSTKKSESDPKQTEPELPKKLTK